MRDQLNVGVPVVKRNICHCGCYVGTGCSVSTVYVSTATISKTWASSAEIYHEQSLLITHRRHLATRFVINLLRY